MSEAEAWTYPPSGFKPDPNRPVRLIERKGQGLFIQYYDVEGRLHELPIVLVAFPPEFQQLRSQLPLQDFWQVLSQNIKSSEIMVPADLQGIMPDAIKGYLTLLASGSRTSSGNTGDIDILHYRNLDILIDVTSVSGTSPTLDVYIDGKFTAVGKYYPIASQTGINTTGQWLLQLRNIPYRYIRVRWVIGGTSPSFTFAVYAEASI